LGAGSRELRIGDGVWMSVMTSSQATFHSHASKSPFPDAGKLMRKRWTRQHMEEEQDGRTSNFPSPDSSSKKPWIQCLLAGNPTSASPRTQHNDPQHSVLRPKPSFFQTWDPTHTLRVDVRQRDHPRHPRRAILYRDLCGVLGFRRTCIAGIDFSSQSQRRFFFFQGKYASASRVSDERMRRVRRGRRAQVEEYSESKVNE